MAIIADDNLIIIDGYGYVTDISSISDLSWIQGWSKKTHGKLHAFHWYGTPDEDGDFGEEYAEAPYGEIEFKKPIPNMIIHELGPFAGAKELWNNARLEEEARIVAEEAEARRLAEEEETRLREAYEALERETAAALQEIETQMSAVEDSYQEQMENLVDIEEQLEEVMTSDEEDVAAQQLEEDLEKLLADL